jgi:hypothetical protein
MDRCYMETSDGETSMGSTEAKGNFRLPIFGVSNQGNLRAGYIWTRHLLSL